MTEIIRKTWNSYVRHDGYVMGWERSEEHGEGHRATLMDDRGDIIPFSWRSRSEPAAGQRVSVVVVKDGVSIRPDRPVLVLNHDTGETIREQNASMPNSTRPIILRLSVWVLVALGVSCIIIAQTAGITSVALGLTAAALITWRLAIAASELKYEERAQMRIRDEEKMCLEIMTGAWRLAADAAFHMDRTKQA